MSEKRRSIKFCENLLEVFELLYADRHNEVNNFIFETFCDKRSKILSLEFY
jgi:hypothetical protein